MYCNLYINSFLTMYQGIRKQNIKLQYTIKSMGTYYEWGDSVNRIVKNRHIGGYFAWIFKTIFKYSEQTIIISPRPSFWIV